LTRRSLSTSLPESRFANGVTPEVLLLTDRLDLKWQHTF
jgi:hypothetical protein